MKSLKRCLLAGICFVLVTGSLAHFLYQWTNQNAIAGLFSPVNESVWEHMKLLFFPMLLFSLFAIRRLSKEYPCILSAMPAGILAGALAIPVIFYTYTGILGRNTLFLDLLTFVISVILAFYTVYRLALSCRMQTNILFLYCLICLFIVGFMCFTYHPPDINLFNPHFAMKK